MNNKKFDEITFDRLVKITKKGMEITSYIAGVNSGAYGLPFIVSVRVWKWGIFKRFLYKEMRLSLYEIKTLKEELEKVIELMERKNE